MIRGELTNLRAVERSDAGLLHSLVNTPDVTSFRARQSAPVSSNEVQRRIEGWLQAEAANGRPDCLIAETIDGESVGPVVVVRAEPAHRAIELELLCSEPDELAADALSAAVDAWFHRWNQHRIWVRVPTSDGPMCRLVEQVGFRIDATLREAAFLDGGYHDIALYCRLATDPEPTEQEMQPHE